MHIIPVGCWKRCQVIVFMLCELREKYSFYHRFRLSLWNVNLFTLFFISSHFSFVITNTDTHTKNYQRLYEIGEKSIKLQAKKKGTLFFFSKNKWVFTRLSKKKTHRTKIMSKSSLLECIQFAQLLSSYFHIVYLFCFGRANAVVLPEIWFWA